MNNFDFILGFLMLTLVGLIGYCLIKGLSECFARQNTIVHRRPIPPQSPPLVVPARSNSRSRGVRCLYRTKDKQTDYAFSIEQQGDGTWRAYIDRQPEYGNRESDAHTTHRLSDGGRQYVCWTDPLQSLAQAKQVAAMWADATQDYIRTGKKF